MPVFFFTDIEGSTRLWEENADEIGAVIAHHDAILQEQVSASGGHINAHCGEIAALMGCQGLKGYPW